MEKSPYPSLEPDQVYFAIQADEQQTLIYSDALIGGDNQPITTLASCTEITGEFEEHQSGVSCIPLIKIDSGTKIINVGGQLFTESCIRNQSALFQRYREQTSTKSQRIMGTEEPGIA